MMYREAAMYKEVGKIDLSKYELPSHAERIIGTQLRFNHVDCDAGADTKQRLYVKAVDTGWIGYCHHCGKSGFLRTSPYRVWDTGSLEYPSEETRTYKEVPYKYSGGEHLYVLPEEFPVEQLLWLYSYGFDDRDIVLFNIKVSKIDGSIVIPKWDSHHDSMAWYVRRKYTDQFDRGPKAMLYKKNPDKNFVWYTAPLTGKNNMWVLTEDPISAMKLCKYGANAISLMGTNLTDDVKLFLTNIEDAHILIYLDPDTAGMKAALKIRKQLQSIVSEVTIHNDPLHGSQPKEERPDVLKQIIERFHDS